MKRYTHEANRPVVRGRNMDYMCPASGDSCICSAGEVEDGIILCGRPAAVIRVHRTIDVGYTPQCAACYIETMRGDPELAILRRKWGTRKVMVQNEQRSGLPGVC